MLSYAVLFCPLTTTEGKFDANLRAFLTPNSEATVRTRPNSYATSWNNHLDITERQYVKFPAAAEGYQSVALLSRMTNRSPGIARSLPMTEWRRFETGTGQSSYLGWKQPIADADKWKREVETELEITSYQKSYRTG